MLQGDASASPSDSHAGHAILHDFCMTIPYGALVAAAGVVSVFMGASTLGAGGVSAGLAVALTSYVSLKEWTKGNSSAPYTLTSASVAAGVGYFMYKNTQQKVAVMPSTVLMVVSAVLALFCVYNVLAGGNPPKKKAAAA